MVLSTCDRGGAERHSRGVQRAAEEETKANLSKGRRKYIYEQVTADLAGLRWITMTVVGRVVTTLPHASRKMGFNHSVGR